MIRTVISSSALGVVILMQYMHEFLGLKVRFGISVAMTLLLAMGCIQVWPSVHAFLTQRRAKWFYAVAFVLLLKEVHDLTATAAVSGGWLAAVDRLEDFFIAGAFILHFLGAINRHFLERWMAVILSLGFYAGVNIVGYQLGYVPLESRYKTIEAIGTMIGERMLAPFSTGLNTFGVIAALGFGLAVLVGSSAFRLRRYVDCVFACTAGIACFVALFLVQMRSSLLVLVFVLLYASFMVWDLGNPKRRMCVLTVMATALGACVLPFIFADAANVAIIDNLLPTAFTEVMGRYSRDFVYLGGRVFIWAYGYELLETGNVGILGQGIAARDSNVAMTAFQGVSSFEFKTTFHNSFLDFLIVYGPILALIWVAATIGIIYSLATRASESINPHARDMWLLRMGVISVLAVIGSLETFTISPIYWGVLIGITVDAGADRHAGRLRPAGSFRESKL